MGIRASGGVATKFLLADAELVAHFGSRPVVGAVDGFSTASGQTLGDLSVTLGAAELSRQGDPFSVDTSDAAESEDVTGGGKRGAGSSGPNADGGGYRDRR